MPAFWVQTTSHEHAFIDRTATRIEDTLTAHGYDVNSEIAYVKLVNEIVGKPGIPNVWNYWIIWPAMVWALATAGYAWFVYGNKPVSETEIKREIERQAGPR